MTASLATSGRTPDCFTTEASQFRLCNHVSPTVLEEPFTKTAQVSSRAGVAPTRCRREDFPRDHYTHICLGLPKRHLYKSLSTVRVRLRLPGLPESPQQKRGVAGKEPFGIGPQSIVFRDYRGRTSSGIATLSSFGAASNIVPWAAATSSSFGPAGHRFWTRLKSSFGPFGATTATWCLWSLQYNITHLGHRSINTAWGRTTLTVRMFWLQCHTASLRHGSRRGNQMEGLSILSWYEYLMYK